MLWLIEGPKAAPVNQIEIPQRTIQRIMPLSAVV
jgi:hypothetical protein